MVGRLRDQNLLLCFTQQLLYAAHREVSGEAGTKSEHWWSIAIASFTYSVSCTKSGIIIRTVAWLIWE